MELYYRTVTFLPEYRNNEAIAAKCLKELHSFNYEYNTRSIGISFPLWNQETVGKKITYVSTNKMELDFLLSRKYFTQMTKLGYFNVSTAQIVPDDCSYALFKRSQSIDKATPAGQARELKRLERRALGRGEIFDPTSYSKNTTHEFQSYHSLEEDSSGGNKFRLNIQMEQLENTIDTGTFSSYGLGNTDNSLQLVPLI
ncbi:type I-F CRISPR-associated endoribonuclease Cas6/Csy4 [Vibrio diazotrophicus]|uniref:type I-F CRISPR-associated endoribonuclease Cas6/Csy4 n=1 Tax=Vibrio diazotrophicus TaxID=685 RepID=UPI000C9E42EA|nr:type I-F CRISPR-associated endoribonuclease Cas6/Csy4 [Vibrio diazotrophicus]PNH98474.1 type I-F CRISPR-associated endoribonuclease Cas6/Csy4 [Vibrio diazotrophicus]